MANWFAGINQASSGIAAARYGLSVVGQNMTNASTPGYVRQTAQQATVDTSGVTGINTGPGQAGGVRISGTTRATDAVLDAHVRSEHALGANAGTTAQALASLEAVLGEPSDTGLAAQLDSFWAAWGTVATNPGSRAVRADLLGKANQLTTTLNTMAGALDRVLADQAQGIDADVSAVNSAAARLATLNGSIALGTATGANVNSLLDERDQLLDTITTRTGAVATLNADGSADVTLGGQPLVDGTASSPLAALADHSFTVGGAPAVVSSGSLGARAAALTTSLPAYRTTLDSVANTLASVVNSAQASGYALDGSSGTAMFGGSGAAGIAVVLADPNGVAASSVAGGSLDAGVALSLAKTALKPGSPDAYFSALVGTVASASAAAQQRASTQDAVSSYVDGLKSSMSGVSLDEEAASMLVYQQAFNASSRVLTAIDQMLDTLINHTGVVGRA